MIPGFDSAQAAYDAAEPDNTDEEAEMPADDGPDPDDQRDWEYDNYDDED